MKNKSILITETIHGKLKKLAKKNEVTLESLTDLVFRSFLCVTMLESEKTKVLEIAEFVKESVKK